MYILWNTRQHTTENKKTQHLKLVPKPQLLSGLAFAYRHFGMKNVFKQGCGVIYWLMEKICIFCDSVMADAEVIPNDNKYSTATHKKACCPKCEAFYEKQTYKVADGFSVEQVTESKWWNPTTKQYENHEHKIEYLGR